jgi:predicted small lipoprotein YifL
MKSFRLWWAIAAALILVLASPITGCGLKGDLYLPQETKAQTAPPGEPILDDPDADDQRAESADSPESAME